MKTVLLSLACLLVAAPALAEGKPDSADAAARASELDLALPKSNGYRNDPPGTWYGDSGKAPIADATEDREQQCEGKLHGSVAAGVGYSSRGGNSNWQAVYLRSCKTYYNDEGEPREVGVSISVGQFDGPNGYYRGGPHPMPPPRR